MSHDAAIEWIAGDDTGISSRAIWAVMMGAPVRRVAFGTHPSDPDDFGRCHRLLEAVPEWRPRMGEMAAHSRVWSRLAEHWDELTQMYLRVVEGGRWNLPASRAMYQRMKELERGGK